MPEGPHPLAFFARTAILLVVLLALWWLVLATPLVTLLRLSVETAVPLYSLAGMQATFSGVLAEGWEFRFVLNDPTPGAAKAISLTVPYGAAVAFTVSMPMYWAIAFGVPIRSQKASPLVRSFLIGSALILLVEVFQFLIYLGVQTWRLKEQVHPTAGGLLQWFYSLAEYLAIYVVPYTAPILIALLIHRPLRARIFAQSPR
jgi:hypothetical protein